MAHTHSPDDTPIVVPPRIKRLLLLAVVPIVVATLIGLFLLRPTGSGPNLARFLGERVELVDGTITSADVDFCAGTPPDAKSYCQILAVRLSTGVDKGTTVELENSIGPATPIFEKGDLVVLGSSGEGGEDTYYFADYQRKTPLLLLGLIFVAAVIALARWRGVRALVALATSLVVLVFFTLPAILRGTSPIAVAIVSAVCIMLIVLYVTDGFHIRATIAVLGTVASLLLIAGLAWVFVSITSMTGLASEEAGFLSAAASEVNLQGLLLGGVIIGALGVLDDMTVTQVSAVWELHDANPQMGVRALYRAGERIGRDHIASTVNTLVLAYAGASLPVLILLVESKQGFTDVVNGEVLAVEVVRTLVGSIGLVASVPITTALAALVLTRTAAEDEGDPRRRPNPLAPLGRGVARLRRSRGSHWSTPRREREWRPPS